jgi:hypothetical protein
MPSDILNKTFPLNSYARWDIFLSQSSLPWFLVALPSFMESFQFQSIFGISSGTLTVDQLLIYYKTQRAIDIWFLTITNSIATAGEIKLIMYQDGYGDKNHANWNSTGPLLIPKTRQLFEAMIWDFACFPFIKYILRALTRPTVHLHLRKKSQQVSTQPLILGSNAVYLDLCKHSR